MIGVDAVNLANDFGKVLQMHWLKEVFLEKVGGKMLMSCTVSSLGLHFKENKFSHCAVNVSSHTLCNMMCKEAGCKSFCCWAA